MISGRITFNFCLDAARLHSDFADTIVELVKGTAASGEPIVRMMEYNYPNVGYGRTTDQFMLGEDILVCPVLEKGRRSRRVVLPEGKWRYMNGSVHEGGTVCEVSAELSVLPYFIRTKS